MVMGDEYGYHFGQEANTTESDGSLRSKCFDK